MARKNTNKNGLDGQRLNQWQRQYDIPELNQQAENLPVRRDLITLLTFVRDNKVIGTQSTGNLPLKAVRQVTSKFVAPPELDMTIGERRSEADVWPLYFLHVLCEVGGLLKIEPGRRWQLTRVGRKFLDAPALLQTALLFSVWWNEVNWLITFPVKGMGGNLPLFFNMFTLEHLQKTYAVERVVSFAEFADNLIEKTGLEWSSPDSSFARESLHTSIQRMVIDILSTFGGLECEYREVPLGNQTTLKLDTFEVTKFGKALLDAIALVMG